VFEFYASALPSILLCSTTWDIFSIRCTVAHQPSCIYINIIHIQLMTGSQDGIVGIATSYGLEGPGNKSRWGRDFPHLSRQALRPTQPPVQWVPGLSRGKGDRGVVLTTHPHLGCWGSRKRVQLYLYSPQEALAACNNIEAHFTLDLMIIVFILYTPHKTFNKSYHKYFLRVCKLS
jgi:hypothetical protein